MRYSIISLLKSLKPSRSTGQAATFVQITSRFSPQYRTVLSLSLKFIVVFVAYYMAAKCGLMVPYKASNITLLWLPSGIAAGAMMRWGKISLLATFSAAFLVESTIGLNTLTALGIAFGNTLAPFVTAYCLRHYGINKTAFNPQLLHQSDIFLLISAALIGMTISALIGTSALFISGNIPVTEVAKVWLIWWVGDSIGVLLALPLILNIRKIALYLNRQQFMQGSIWLALFMVCELIIFSVVDDINKQFMLSAFLILPLLIWVAMHFGIVGGSLVVVSLSAVVVWITSIGLGELYSRNINEGLFSLWLFILSLVVVMLLISSMQAERRYAVVSLKSNARKFRAVIDGALDGIITIDGLGQIIEFNPAAERMFGYKKAEVMGQSLDDLIVPKNQRKQHKLKHSAYVETGEKHLFDQRLELTALRSDGTEFPVELTITALKDDEDNPQGYVTGFIRDISAQKSAQLEVEKMLFYDMLTGLANRRLLIERFNHARSTIERSNKHYALMFIDLDNFKLLNDTKGHDVGDLLLKELAKRLQASLRASDTLARLSGDEFVIILENLDAVVSQAEDQVVGVAKKILSAISQPFNLDGFSFSTTGSIGIALLEKDTLSFEDHLRHTDTAMYLAKARGRNTYCFYDAATQSVIDRQLLIESALKDALANNELHLYYQGIVDQNQTLRTAEVLLRWQSHSLGAVSPSEFIPVAEKSGYIIAIGNWVLVKSIEQLKAWQSSEHLKDLILSVNISAKQLLRDDFVSNLRDLLTQHQVSAESLKLELTETAAIGHFDDAIAKFQALRAMGVRIALDDFGTGQSSLTLIKKLPVTMLKIDISFVSDMLSDSNDAAIIKMIIAIGKTIGCRVVAEGVETEAQFEALKADDCTFFQGYHFSKPEPLSAFEQHVIMATKAAS